MSATIHVAFTPPSDPPQHVTLKELKKFPIKQLKALAIAYQLSISGKKGEIAERVYTYLAYQDRNRYEPDVVAPRRMMAARIDENEIDAQNTRTRARTRTRDQGVIDQSTLPQLDALTHIKVCPHCGVILKKPSTDEERSDAVMTEARMNAQTILGSTPRSHHRCSGMLSLTLNQVLEVGSECNDGKRITADML